MALNKLKKILKKEKPAKVEEVKASTKVLPEELHQDYDPSVPLNKQRHLR